MKKTSVLTTPSACGRHPFKKLKGNYCILFSALLLFCFSQATAQTWPPAGMLGDGLSENTAWQIETHQHLKALADYVNAGNGSSTGDKYYKLMNNISLSSYASGEGWEPIGYESGIIPNINKFQGFFNGNNKVITDLTITAYAHLGKGLFGCCNTIYNLGVINVNIQSQESFTGGIAGRCDNIYNCYSTGNVNGTSNVGGLVGDVNGNVLNCYSTCNVNGGSCVGGLVGYINGNVLNCYSTGNVSGLYSCVGGLIGEISGNKEVKNCYASGTVIGGYYWTGNMSVGGLVGSSNNSFIINITNCVAANDSVVSKYNGASLIGRIIGNNYKGEYKNNYAFEGMIVKSGGINVSITPSLNGQHGANATMAQLKSPLFYNTQSNWSGGVWDICPPSGVWKICIETFPLLRYQQDIVCNIIPITNITGVPTTTFATIPLTLTGTIVPSNATYLSNIVWSVSDAGTTGATISGNILNTTNAGTVVVKATVMIEDNNYTQNFSILVDKYAQTPPPSPTLASKTFTSITLNSISNCEYRKDNGEWQTSTVFNGLSPATTYSFYARKIETVSQWASPPSENSDFTTNIPVTGITDVPTTATATVPLTLTGTVVPSNATNQTIVWSVKTAGTTGAVISGNVFNASAGGTAEIRATINNGTATGNYIQDFNITVNKAPQTPPNAPTLASKTFTSITLNPITNCEYRRDNGEWQSSTVFNGLSPATTYSFYARKIETAALLASPPSGNTDIATNVPVTNITGVPANATADVSLTITGTVVPSNATYQTIVWSVKNGGTTGAYIYGNTFYAPAGGTAEIRATIDNGGIDGTYTQDFNIVVNKAPQTPPDAPTLASKTFTSITLNYISNCEYRKDNGEWQTSTVFNGLSPATTYSFSARKIETPALLASPPSENTDISTNIPVTNITGVPTTATANVPLTLTSTVVPSNATYQTIVWSVKNAGTTGAYISGNIFYTSASGTAEIRATIYDGGLEGTYTQDFNIVVNKAPQTAPPSPTLASKTFTSITLNSISNCEYRKDNGEWQSSNVFNDLSPATTYSFYARKKETPALLASPPSENTDISTNIPVSNITNVPPTATMNIPLTLTGTVDPNNATFQTIAWSLVYAGTTGAELISGILYTSTPGTAVVKATIINGTDIGQNYTQNFSIIVNSEFVPVTNITGVPTTATVGALTLTGTVVPSNATNQTIVWSVNNAGTTGATITGNSLNTTGVGTAVVTATIANGGVAGANYAKDFNIVISKTPQEAPPAPTLEDKTATSIKLTTVSGCEYSINNGSGYQTSPQFNGLMPNTSYTFVQRKAETTTHSASEASPAATFTTDAYTITNISGTVFRPNQTALSSGEVSLYRVQTMTKYILVETVQIGGDGSFVFNDVSQGGYIVKATAPPEENALPTYYGNNENWEQALLITVANLSVSNIDITIIPERGVPEGTSGINGYVVEEGSKKSRSAVEDAVVYLLAFEDSKWTTVATTSSDENGYFEFVNLHAGKYMTIVDAPGIKMLNSIPLDLAAADTINIVFTITDEGIETKIGTVGIATPTLPEIKVYPNPTTGELRIESSKFKVQSVEIFDVFGRKIPLQFIEGVDGAAGRGSYRSYDLTVLRSYDLTHFPTGVYFVKIHTEKGSVNKKVVKQ